MPNTLFIGKVYLRFDELPSTNDFARDLLAEGRPAEGTVIRAERQPEGRGQFGARWESAPGENLTFSVILYPVFLRAVEQFRLNEAVALALRDCVKSVLREGEMQENLGQKIPRGFSGPKFSGPGKSETPNPKSQISVKWPNDLYLGDRKAAGVLIQNAISGEWLKSSVVGIGLNLNQRIFRSDAPNPVSLASVAGRDLDLDAVALSLFKHLEMRYLQLKSGPRKISALREEYSRSLFQLEEMMRFGLPGGQVFWGKIRGVADDGRLRVEVENGTERLFGLKEIRFLTT